MEEKSVYIEKEDRSFYLCVRSNDVSNHEMLETCIELLTSLKMSGAKRARFNQDSGLKFSQFIMLAYFFVDDIEINLQSLDNCVITPQERAQLINLYEQIGVRKLASRLEPEKAKGWSPFSMFKNQNTLPEANAARTLDIDHYLF